MATRGIQEKLSNGTITEIRIGSVAAGSLAVKQSQLDLKRDLSNMTFGNAGNVSEFDPSTGHLEFKGSATVFEDDNMDPTMLAGQGEPLVKVPIPGTTIDIAGFAWNKITGVEGCKEYPHKAKLNASGETSVTFSFHFHIFPTSSAGGNAVFQLEHVFSEEGVAIPVSTVETIVVAIGTTAWARQTEEFTAIVAPENLGAQFHFKFSRLATDIRDTYTANIAVSTIGYHYEIDGAGSRQITVK